MKQNISIERFEKEIRELGESFELNYCRNLECQKCRFYKKENQSSDCLFFASLFNVMLEKRRISNSKQKSN